MSFITTRHGHVFVTSIGSGPPLVLLHGNTMTAMSQQRLAQRFADTYRVVSVDLPGHGQSARPDNLFTPDYFTILGEAVADLLTELVPDGTATLFGMSAGAIAALNAACTSTRHIDALILDSLFHSVSEQTLRTHREHAHATSPVWDRFMRKQHGDTWWPKLREGVLATIEQLAESQRSVIPCLTAMERPALVFQGGRDVFCPESHGREIAAALPDARLIYDSQAGHILAWQYPAAFHELVRAFVSTLPKQKGTEL